MSDPREHKDRISAPESRQESNAADERVPAPDPSAAPSRQWSRRRFGKTALGVTPIIATLYGRPLWAEANCTMSGWTSGNTSTSTQLSYCGGKTPGYWQGPASKSEHPGWERLAGEPLDSAHCFSGLSFYVNGKPCTMQQAVEGPGRTPLDGTDMLTRQIVRYGTAALLNARYLFGYSLTETQVIEMVGMCVLGDGYTTQSGDFLSREKVKAFLENTMDSPSWGS